MEKSSNQSLKESWKTSTAKKNDLCKKYHFYSLLWIANFLGLFCLLFTILLGDNQVIFSLFILASSNNITCIRFYEYNHFNFVIALIYQYFLQ